MSWWDSFVFGMGAKFGSLVGDVLFIVLALGGLAVMVGFMTWFDARRKRKETRERQRAPTSGNNPGP